MINGVNSFSSPAIDAGKSLGSASQAGKAGASQFGDTFKKYLDEVNQLQQDASQAVQDNATGVSDNLDGVMVAMEKSDLAFKTLMAIRTKLLDAYEELKNMPI
jgi:flagellar hook-basal body complex protein FliE